MNEEHLAEILSRSTPEAADAIRKLDAKTLAELMDDDDLFNGEPDWTLRDVEEYTDPAW